MQYKLPEGQPTLMAFLAIGPLRQVVKTRLFGGPYLRFYDLLDVSGFLYETGALLGRAKRDKLTTLEKMLARPKKKGEFIEFLQEQAKERLDKFEEEVRKEPDSFTQLFGFQEFERMGLILFPELEEMGLSLTRIMCGDAHEQARLSERMDFGLFMKKQVKIADEKMNLEKAEPFIKLWGQEGIGFGSCFPELTEKMYRNAHENIDMVQWSEMRAHGAILPEKPTIISLEEQEKTALQMVAAYASEYYPELLDPLDLRGYIDIDAEGSR